MNERLVINEVFHSIQGEGTRAGYPCVFIRLTGCHLRCHYCDTEYAFHEGGHRTINDLVAEVEGFACDLVEVTGGEPLLQPNVHRLMADLCEAGKTVLVETSGSCDISKCDSRVIRILDLKTPGSGEADRNLWSNVDHLTRCDEVKFVICNRSDYVWARHRLLEHRLHDRVAAVLMSAASFVEAGTEIAGAPGLPLEDLVEWVLADGLPVKLQIQLHKLIWDPLRRRV